MTATKQRAVDMVMGLPDEQAEMVIGYIVSLEQPKVDFDSVFAAGGMLHQYADPSKWPLEEGAFERAMVEKHEVD